MNHLNALIIDLEKALLDDEVRASQERLNTLIHDDFLEYSQSGGSYGKQAILDAFKGYMPDGSTYKTKNFNVRLLSHDLAQVTYETISIPKNDTIERKALRSSLWKKEEREWQMIFHQGTIKND
ncbi:MAG: nuclear transport factor 2 family protein [Alphaproteobacteria bacterium]|nr:nuclear transport factor 2 family protein [Alphaproteobacteria bacterium]